MLFRSVSCALLRNGFVISDNSSEELQVEIRESGEYVVSGIDEIPEYLYSIKDMLDYVKQPSSPKV